MVCMVFMVKPRRTYSVKYGYYIYLIPLELIPGNNLLSRFVSIKSTFAKKERKWDSPVCLIQDCWLLDHRKRFYTEEANWCNKEKR